MSPLLKFMLRRLALIPLTLLIVTAVLYGGVMFTPPEARAQLYLNNSNAIDRMSAEQLQRLIQRIIRDYGLNEPYPVQYFNWIRSVIGGEWGWSPVFRASVLDLIQARAPITIELTLWSMIVFIPTGILSGVIASRRRGRLIDRVFGVTAFGATSIPPFVLGLMMISFLYIGLGWFAPNRLSADMEIAVRAPDFTAFTGLYTLDGVLNGRLDISLDALQHLVMPVLSLSALHWATVGRVTRTTMVEELDKDYVIAAQARGVSERRIMWKHVLRNALIPALTTSVLSAASLVSGVYVIERVFNLHGVSELIAGTGLTSLGDAPLALGFAIYSVSVVLIVMFVLDLAQAIVDPRLRERLTE
ncbi:Dipeptide transport system permease protein DppB [Gammaproteobacteria bacterium]|nr:Dipeptide transport system permease protein DppB [Gammaproteobacteria bacterium]